MKQQFAARAFMFHCFCRVDEHVALLVRRQGLPKIEAVTEAGAVVVLFDFVLAQMRV